MENVFVKTISFRGRPDLFKLHVMSGEEKIGHAYPIAGGKYEVFRYSDHERIIVNTIEQVKELFCKEEK